MKRGRDIHAEYAARLEQERLAQPTVGRCQWCPTFIVEGPLEHTRQALLEHRLAEHPQARERKHKRRRKPMIALVTTKTLDENIAAARQQGAATWEGAA